VAESIGQCPPLDELHHDVVGGVLAADIEDGTDVGVTQTRERLCFALESSFEVRSVRQMCGEYLDGHGAVEPLVASSIHFSHATSTNRRHDFVWT
jgi:hypothetical protein